MSTVVLQSLTAVLETTPPLVLDCVSAVATLDESRAPYGEISLVIHTPAEADAELIDPRTGLRVTVTAAQEWLVPARPAQSRVFDLILHERVIDWEAGETTLTLRTDEAKLIDDGLIATAVDTSAYAVESSLRDIIDQSLAVIGASLAVGSDDADFTRTSNSTNLFLNPSAEVNGTGWVGANCSAARTTAWAATGTISTSLILPTSDDSYVVLEGGVGGVRNGMTTGKTYVASGTFRLTAPLTGTPISSARRIVVVANTGAGGFIFAQSSQAPNAAGVYRLYVEFTAPASITELYIRWYHGHTGGTIWLDALRLSEKTGVHDDAPLDGSLSDPHYAFAWTGVTHASISTRTRLDNRDITLLDRQPGEPSWDFLQPLVQQAGLRLFCDEARVWRVVDSNSYTVDGIIRITEAENLTAGTDQISLAGDWATGVVVKYSWTDAAGASHVAYDAAGTSTKVALVEWERPYPGPGAAQVILDRMQGRGRILDPFVLSELTATPGQYTQSTVPNAPIQTGIASSVSWSIPDALMGVGTRALIDTPVTAWAFLAAGQRWVDSPAGASWISETV